MAFFGNQNFMNFNQNINDINQNEIIEDVYDYIIEEKKNIIFIRYDNSTKKVKIPNSLRKNELYLTANLYKLNKYSDITLSRNNLNLSADESSISDIPEGSEIYIIEELDVDSQYYKNYLKKHENETKINISFETNEGRRRNLSLTLNTTIQEMIKIYLFESNIPEKYKNDFTFHFNGMTINNEKSTLYEFQTIANGSKIQVIENSYLVPHKIKGKPIKASIMNKKDLLFNFKIGTLNQIKDLYSYLRTRINNFDEIQKIEIEGREYKNEQNNTFSSIGIRKDFVCTIKYTEECCCIIL